MLSLTLWCCCNIVNASLCRIVALAGGLRAVCAIVIFEATMSRMMSQREKVAGNRPALVESTSSDSNDGAFQELLKPVKILKATEEIHSNHLSIWREPFDLRKLPETITLELLKRAPFLLGTEKAKYNKLFFKTIGGLYDAGIPFESLAKEEHGVPLEDLLATFPLNKNENRHSLRFIIDCDAARDALHMYQRVYGGTHPDNGEFGTAFIRGLVLYYQRQTQVDWAEFATDLAKKQMQNPLVNPQKLTPPCLREQIQAMITMFERFLRSTYAGKEDAIAQLRRANLPVKPSNILSRQQGSAELVEIKPLAGWEGHVEAPRPPNGGSACSSKPVQQHRTSRRSSPLQPTEAGATTSPPNTQSDPLAALKEKRRKTEKQLFSGIKHLHDAKSEFELLGAKKTELGLSEDANWEVMVALFSNKKSATLTSEEGARVEEELRTKTSIANSIFQSIADVQKQMAELQDRIQLFRRTTKELQDEVGVITADIEVLTLDSSSIRPKQLLTRLLVTCINRVKLEVDVPCVLCGRFWVDNAFMCLPCGCLLHPFCIFKVAFSTDPRYPFCNHALGSLWRSQWGYATDNDKMHSAIFCV